MWGKPLRAESRCGGPNILCLHMEDWHKVKKFDDINMKFHRLFIAFNKIMLNVNKILLRYIFIMASKVIFWNFVNLAWLDWWRYSSLKK